DDGEIGLPILRRDEAAAQLTRLTGDPYGCPHRAKKYRLHGRAKPYPAKRGRGATAEERVSVGPTGARGAKAAGRARGPLGLDLLPRGKPGCRSCTTSGRSWLLR